MAKASAPAYYATGTGAAIANGSTARKPVLKPRQSQEAKGPPPERRPENGTVTFPETD